MVSSRLLILGACALAGCASAPAATPTSAIAPQLPAEPGSTRLAATLAQPPAEAPPAVPPHITYHYKADAQPGRFDQWGEGHLDPQTKDRFAEGMRLDCPGPGTLHAETTADPEGTQLRLAVYLSGNTAAAVSTTGTVDARIEKAGPCYVVVSVPSFSWDCTFRVRASFIPEAGGR